jgi:hypothetical protein
LLHKATGLKRHQQAVHRTFGQTKGAGNVGDTPSFWALLQSEQDVEGFD